MSALGPKRRPQAKRLDPNAAGVGDEYPADPRIV